MTAVGPGVERLAEEVAERFPNMRASVLSSDLFHSARALKEAIAEIGAGQTDIIIGTQLVAKGHNFPRLTLVGVIDADLGLQGADMRAAERSFQLMRQVAGRAGREGGEARGLALLQTYQPDHPVIRAIALHFQIGYDHPFCDGNGRTARTLFYWSMLRSGYWLTEFLSVSSVFKRAKAQYLRAYLYTETDEADLGYFVDHHLDVILGAIDGLHGWLARKADERHRTEGMLRPGSHLGGKLNHRQRELLLNAVRYPDKTYRIDRHMQIQNISYQTARSDLLALVKLKLMRSERIGKAFVFMPVGDLVEKLKK